MDGVIRDQFQEQSATMGLLWDLVMHLIDIGSYSTVSVQWHMLNSEGGTVQRKRKGAGGREYRVDQPLVVHGLVSD
jgi:hypothetical protein